MKDLVIPVRLDHRGAVRGLEELGQAGQESGEKASEGVSSIGLALSNLAVNKATDALLAGARGIAAAYQETSRYIHEAANKFVELQQTLQQVAALTGKANTGQFTVEQAKQAEAAGVTPDQWRTFQEVFQSYGGASLDAGPDQKMNAAEATKYQQQLAHLAQARGINPAEIAQMGAGVLQFAKGPMTADEAMAELGRQYKVLERAPTPVPQLMPQMTRVESQGLSGAEAAELLNVMSFAMPGEEQTGVENTLKALNKALLKGKGADIGISKEQTPYQMIRAAAENLQARKAHGEDISALLAEYFPDMRELRGIKGFMSQGVAGGRFAQAEEYYKETPRDFAQSMISEYEANESGIQNRAKVANVVAEVVAGQRMSDIPRLMNLAEKQLKDEGRFEHMGETWGDTLRGISAQAGAPSVRQQLINERAVAMAYREAGKQQTGLGNLGDAQSVVDQEILSVLRDANNQRRRQTAIAEQQARPPLAAPPPDHQARR